jgi:hypothetical protein
MTLTQATRKGERPRDANAEHEHSMATIAG